MLDIYLDLVPESAGTLLQLHTQIFEKYAADNNELQDYLDNFSEKVWERMRKHDHLPHIGNIYQGVVLEFSEMVLEAVMPDANVSHDEYAVYVDIASIESLRDFNKVYKEYQAQQQLDENDTDD